MSAEDTLGKRVDSGSFHGTGGSYAKLRSHLAAVCAIAVLAYPWMDVVLAHHHPRTAKSGSALIEAVSATAIWTGR